MRSEAFVPTSSFEAGDLPRRAVSDGQSLSPDDPAIHVITDFTREQPVTVDPDCQIDDALNDMIRFGVRALLVLKDQRVVGLITSYDIQGERPIQFLQSSNYSHHSDIRVSHVMTPWPALKAVTWNAIQSMRAGDLLRLVEEAGLTHLIVVDADRTHSTCTIRALVSRARLTRQIKGMRRAG